MPPTITLEQMKGFSLFALKAVLSGHGDEILDLAKINFLLKGAARGGTHNPHAAHWESFDWGSSMTFETLNICRDGSILFAEIASPPMNLLGPALVRDLVSHIQQAEADDSVRVLVFKSADPDYFISHVDVTKIKALGWFEEIRSVPKDELVALIISVLGEVTEEASDSPPRMSQRGSS